MKDKHYLVLLVLVVLFVSCATNPFKATYEKAPNVNYDKYWNEGGTNPKIFIYSDNPSDDENRLMSNGYFYLGQSAFNTSPLSFFFSIENLLKEQAKRLQADIVLYHNEYLKTNSFTYYQTQSSYNYLSNTTTTTIIPATISVDQYSYMATYWKKAQGSKMGLFVKDLTNEEKRLIKSNKGISVGPIIIDSAAYKSDILPGDIIISLNDTVIKDREEYYKFLENYSEKNVSLKLIRDNQELNIEVELEDVKSTLRSGNPDEIEVPESKIVNSVSSTWFSPFSYYLFCISPYELSFYFGLRSNIPAMNGYIEMFDYDYIKDSPFYILLEDTTYWRGSFTFGITYPIVDNVYGMAGLGLGVYNKYRLYQDTFGDADKYWALMNYNDNWGLETEIGLIFDFGLFNINIGTSTLMFRTFDPFLGLGISL